MDRPGKSGSVSLEMLRKTFWKRNWILSWILKDEKCGEGVEGGGHYSRNEGPEKRAWQSLEGQGRLEQAVKREDSTSEGSPVSAKWGT